MSYRILLVTCAASLLGSAAWAVQVRIDIENIAQDDGVATSPFTVVAHDGSFDAFDPGSPSSLGIENIAETGNGTELTSEATTAYPMATTATVVASTNGFNDAIFKPGASGFVVLDLDPAIHRYLTFGAMVVPSNDAFFGNASPTEVELFDAGGAFVAADFTLSGADIWDAGTEVNQLFGSAYVVGQSATDGDVEIGGTIAAADLNALFGLYLGEQTPAGATFGSVPTASGGISRFSFSVVPEPTAMLLLTTMTAALGVVRQRNLI